MEDILVYLKQFCDIKENVSFKVLTTYKVGGIARAVIYPFDIDSTDHYPVKAPQLSP